MDLAKIKINVGAVERGEWKKNLPNFGDLEIKLRGLRSAAYRTALGAKVRSLPRSEREEDGNVKMTTIDRVTGEALAEKIVLDWKNLEIDGESVPYSLEAATMLLTDPEYVVFREAVHSAADQIGELGAEAEETTLGNSAKPLSGSSNGPRTPKSSSGSLPNAA